MVKLNDKINYNKSWYNQSEEIPRVDILKSCIVKTWNHYDKSQKISMVYKSIIYDKEAFYHGNIFHYKDYLIHHKHLYYYNFQKFVINNGT